VAHVACPCRHLRRYVDGWWIVDIYLDRFAKDFPWSVELSQAHVSEGRTQSSAVVPPNVPVGVFSQLFAGGIDVAVGPLLPDEVCRRTRTALPQGAPLADRKRLMPNTPSTWLILLPARLTAAVNVEHLNLVERNFSATNALRTGTATWPAHRTLG
jgi:hypothetical protein